VQKCSETFFANVGLFATNAFEKCFKRAFYIVKQNVSLNIFERSFFLLLRVITALDD